VNHAAIDRQLFAGDAKFFARKFDKDAARPAAAARNCLPPSAMPDALEAPP